MEAVITQMLSKGASWRGDKNGQSLLSLMLVAWEGPALRPQGSWLQPARLCLPLPDGPLQLCTLRERGSTARGLPMASEVYSKAPIQSRPLEGRDYTFLLLLFIYYWALSSGKAPRIFANQRPLAGPQHQRPGFCESDSWTPFLRSRRFLTGLLKGMHIREQERPSPMV